MAHLCSPDCGPVTARSVSLFEQADLDRDIAAIIARLGAAGFEVAYDSGQGMTLDEVVRMALDERKQA